MRFSPFIHIGFLVIGVAMIAIPFCHNFIQVMVVIGIMIMGMSAVEIAVLPMMGYLVDIRHDGHHGKVYSLYTLSFTLASIFGPVLGGPLTDLGKHPFFDVCHTTQFSLRCISHNPEFSDVCHTTQFSPMYVTQPRILQCMSHHPAFSDV